VTNICFSGVLYNNFSDLVDFITSVQDALNFFESKQIRIRISVVNNGQPLEGKELQYIQSISGISILLLEKQGNVGYFPGVKIGYEKIVGSDLWCVVACNFDLTLQKDFFVNLFKYRDSSPVVLAPSIWSINEKKDRNPKILERPSKRAMVKYKLLFTIPYFHYLYNKTFYKLKRFIGRSKDNSYTENLKIYAPHGSFVIFINCSEFLSQIFDYPIFLFGEEIFIGEILKQKNIPCIFDSTIKILDKDHGSTSLESERFIRVCNLKAIRYLNDNFWQ
jgi:GT2 family glycosyltransferase